MANKQDTISIGFEEKIWKAADILRGSLDASQYKGVVLGLIFLKYISDRFEQKFQELQGDEYADPEDKDEYTADNIFFVPAEARWSQISAAAHTPQIGVVIDEALTAIERENERLKGILPKNFARPELDKRRLGDVVDLFTDIEMHDAGEGKDLLGRTYEYCLQQFASLEGKNAGEFYTPSCIVRTLVEILEPYEGRAFDPCCGSGGMFVQSAKFIERHKGNLRKISIYGQESNPETWKIAHMNLAIHGLEANLGSVYADHFFEDHSQMFMLDYNGYGQGEEWNTWKDRRYFMYSLKDMMLGAEMNIKYGTWLRNIVFEYLYTKYQSGPYNHDRTQNISDHIAGTDDYYNHSAYTGWQHWGQVIGNPLFRSPIYNTNEKIGVYDNRFVAFHLGFDGQPTDRLSYRALATWQKGWGTYSDPFTKAHQNVSFMLESTYRFNNGWQATAAYGMDFGSNLMLGHNAGGQITVCKKGLFKGKKVKR